MLRRIDPKTASYRTLDQRTAPRTDCYARIPVTMPDLLQQILTLVNISADGALFRTDRKLDEGDLLSIKFPIIGSMDAHVAWSAGGQTGVQFEYSIRPQDYIPLLKAMGVNPAAQ